MVFQRLNDLNHKAAKVMFLYVPESGVYRALETNDIPSNLPKAPHDIGNYTPFHKGFNLTQIVNSSGFWTPAANKKFVVTDIQISIDGSTNAVLFHEGPTETNTTKWVARFRGGSKSNTSVNFAYPYVAASGGSILYIRTETSSETMGTVHGYEISI
jgi:hypothetical protein